LLENGLKKLDGPAREAAFSVDLTIGPSGGLVEWVGSSPKRKLTGMEIARYRKGRDRLLLDLAQKIDGNIMLVEV
jgi:hypothetical protein